MFTEPKLVGESLRPRGHLLDQRRAEAILNAEGRSIACSPEVAVAVSQRRGENGHMISQSQGGFTRNLNFNFNFNFKLKLPRLTATTRPLPAATCGITLYLFFPFTRSLS
jgi:hypothetical protein